MKKLLFTCLMLSFMCQTASAQYYDGGYNYEPYGEDLYYPPRYNRRLPQSSVEILEEGPVTRRQKPPNQRRILAPQPPNKPESLSLKNVQATPPIKPAALMPNPQYMPQEIIFEFKPEASPQIIDQIIAANKLERIASWKFKLTNSIIFQYRIKDGRSVEAVMAALAQNTDILSAQPNYIYNLQPKETGSNLQTLLEAMHVKGAQESSSGTGVTVSVAGLPRSEILSVAPNAKIITQNGQDEFAPQKKATGFQLLRNIDWAFENKARIVNIGFAGTYDKSVSRMIAAASSQKMIIVVSQSSIALKTPVTTSDPNVITVTSPYTTGVIALMLQLKPDLNTDDVRRVLAQSTTKNKMPDGTDLKIVDALAAVKAINNPLYP